MLSKLEETLTGPYLHADLGCNLFPGAVHPQGYRLLSTFALDPVPTFTYASGEIILRKRLVMLNQEHTLAIVYELVRAPSSIQLELRPLVAGRDYHHLLKANDTVQREAIFKDGTLSCQPYAGQPTVHIHAPGSHFQAQPDWHYNFEYPRERERGLDYSEDLFSYGRLRCILEPGKPFGVIVSDTATNGRDGVALLEAEIQRRDRIKRPTHIANHPLALRLATAADPFIVRRDQDRYTILAGYHWFTDWGRDTMIALPGLCLVTERFAEARRIFRAFAAHNSQGMIPNRFPDAGETPDYNTVDATLWFFVALYKYLNYTNDYAFVRNEMWATLKDMVEWHGRGTRYHIHVDGDSLLHAGEQGVQLTWMDAKVGDWVVTPRQGKAVEINALWYNTLKIAAHLANQFDEPQAAQDYSAQAATVATRFAEVFWNDATGCLFDVVNNGQGDGAIRPNQIFALSLPFPLLSEPQALQVFDVVDRHLFTPRGLRSLSPKDPAYRPVYIGGPWERDGAYHQGTVWGWLMGPFITALVKLHGQAGRQRAATIIEGIEPHLSEAGLGTVSEIFDAEPPFTPRGCIAQAWSVAELLRAYCEDVLGD
jgi:predicted glycogen debranching enzyme